MNTGPGHPRVEGFPHWLKDIDANLPVTAHFVIHGNIRDRHLLPPPVPQPGTEASAHPRFLDTVPAIWECLVNSGYEFLLHHSPIHGLQVVPRTEEAVAAASEVLRGSVVTLGQQVGFEELVEVLQRVANSRAVRCALVVDYLSQVHPVGEPPSDELHQFMLAALGQVHQGHGFVQEGPRRAALYNPSFWLVDRPSDLPAWMVSGSDGIRQIPIPMPDVDMRTAVAELLVPNLPTDGSEVDLPSAIRRFAETTEGMTVRGMIEVRQLAQDTGLPAARIEDSVRAYRMGLIDNPWKRPVLRERITQGEEYLSGFVKGQSRAIRHAVDILVRSTTGMSAAQQRGVSSGPRGVMFFAGPTGVGKTELAKAITSLVFGDERAYIRFDMSEFTSDASEARLVGAPPGYIGHGGGGELTNAVRQKPFSLVLFDEIEKADPRILDKFLQILSDGRLTDGSGGTVHFSETLIVFTSNLGMLGVEVQGETAAERSASLESQVRANIEREFRERINRPELLGRIGDNIVVFDYLSDEIGRELVSGFLNNVTARVLKEHGIELELTPAAKEQLTNLCVADLSLGGRGVAMMVESCLVNPLARQLITSQGATSIRVTEVREADGDYEVVIG